MPLHITHVISGLDPRAGGPPSVLVGLTQALVSSGVSVSVVSTWNKNDDHRLVDQLRDHHINVRLVGPCIGPLQWHPKLRSTINDTLKSSDVVHIHALWEQSQHAAATAARRMGIPYVFTPHGMLDPWSLSQKKLKKKLYLTWRLRNSLNRAATIHYTSITEKTLTKPLKLKAPAIVIPNGIDLAEFESLPPKNSFRAKWPAIGDRPMLLFLGRIHYKKGLDLLIPAFATTQNKNAVLVIAGPSDPEYLNALKQLTAQHQITNRVVFTGMLHGPHRIEAFTDADLFVLPSYQENFGIAVIEALAAETPVVISDQVNIHDQITAAGVGGVVPTRIDALAKELDRWMSDVTLRRQAAKRARSFVNEHYDWAKIAECWQAQYSDILDAR